jgi:hypothetical protein
VGEGKERMTGECDRSTLCVCVHARVKSSIVKPTKIC